MGWKFYWSCWQSPVLPWRVRAIWERDEDSSRAAGEENSASLWCLHWIANSLLENFRTGNLLSVDPEETWKLQQCPAVSNTAFWMFVNSVTAALQKTALVSQADFSQTEVEGKHIWRRKERGREGKVQTRLLCSCCLPIFLQFGSN